MTPNKYVDSRRLFYRQYLYKAVITLPKARIIYDSTPVSECIANRHRYHLSTQMFRNTLVNVADSVERFKDMYKINEERLCYYRQVYLETKGMRFRVEEPWLHLYTNDYTELLHILKYDPAPQYFVIHRPAGTAERVIIERGEMIATDRHNGIDYRVHIAEGFVSQDIKTALITLADTYPNDVYIPQRLKEKLKSSSHTWTSGYFYINDLKLLTFINLIDPKFVTSFFKMTRPEQ